MKEPKRAFVLVGMLMVLMALGCMGVSFIAISTMQLKISKNYSDKVQSDLISQGGIDLAISNLYQYFRQDNWYNRTEDGFMVTNWYYGGEDINSIGFYTWAKCLFFSTSFFFTFLHY